MSAVQEVVLGHVTEWFKKAALSLTFHRPQAGFALPPALRWWGRDREWKPARSHPNSRLWTARDTFSYSAVRPQLYPQPFGCFVLIPEGKKRRQRTGRMNSIKQVPTRVRSRRVEANLGAEREHFEKQQVNAENRVVVFLWENICCFLRSQWLRHRECARACGGDGTGSHARLLQLEICDFSLWIKYIDSKTTLEGVYFTMRAWARWRVMSPGPPLSPGFNLSIRLF